MGAHRTHSSSSQAGTLVLHLGTISLRGTLPMGSSMKEVGGEEHIEEAGVVGGETEVGRLMKSGSQTQVEPV